MDINSCFATIEQQANPLLRGKPIAVAAYTSGNGCILAASVEAKKLGVKTGMMVREGKQIYPKLIVLSPDPDKYRNVHNKFKSLISQYTNDFAPKSIDEFVMNMRDYMTLKDHPLKIVAQEIKERVKKEIGEWITVSIGIAPNRYLAKVAAGIKKPDGLIEINKDNYLEIYSKLALIDLTGIKTGNSTRLNSVGIYTVLDFYNAPIWKIKAAFHSITGLYWHTRLHGYEVDDIEFGRRSYGNSVALGKNLSTVNELSPVLARLTEKMSARIREDGYKARGIHLALVSKNGGFWHKGRLTKSELFDTRDFFREALNLLREAHPNSPVRNIAVSAFSLTQSESSQLELFRDISKNENLIKAMDQVNQKWGDFTLGMAESTQGGDVVLDRIAFGR
jgi:DNA polymerase-4